MPPPKLGKHLEWHRGKIRVTLGVPQALRPILGTSRLKHSLRTDSPSVAERLKGPVILDLRRKLAEAAKGTLTKPEIAAALAIREQLASATEAEEEVLDWFISDEGDRLRGEPVATDQGHDGEPLPLFDPAREAKAATFVKIARGLETPLTAHLTRWYGEQPDRKKRTRGGDALAFDTLERWCRANHVAPTIEAIDRRAAGLFVSSLPTFAAYEVNGVVQPLTNKTVNRYLSSLRSHWRWLRRRGLIEANPWEEQSLPKAKEDRDSKERPFTDDEVRKILAGHATPAYLPPLIRIGALSGARLDAIACLRVRDCLDGVFIFKPQKKEGGRRLVPIHSDLVELIASLCKGKEPDAFILPGIQLPSEGSQREVSSPASAAFTRYRRSVGVDDVRPGKRRSLVNYHSFRRWFIKKAREALQRGAQGFDPWTIADVVGHDTESMELAMTMGRYPGAASVDAMRACVEAVKLPS